MSRQARCKKNKKNLVNVGALKVGAAAGPQMVVAYGIRAPGASGLPHFPNKMEIQDFY